MRWIWLTLFGLNIGCSDREADRAALERGMVAVAQQAAPPAYDTLDSPDMLRRILQRSFAAHAPKLGTRQWRVWSKVEWETAELEDSLVVHVDGAGQFSVKHQVRHLNAQDTHHTGRGCWWVKDRYAVAALKGPVIEIPVQADEPMSCLNSVIDPFGVWVAAFAEQVDLSSHIEGDQSVVLGELKSPLELNSDRQELDLTILAVPIALEFEARFDLATGVLIYGHLHGQFRANTGQITVEVKVESEGGGQVVMPTIDQIWTPRPRPVLARKRVLQGPEPIVIMPGPDDAPPLRPKRRKAR